MRTLTELEWLDVVNKIKTHIEENKVTTIKHNNVDKPIEYEILDFNTNQHFLKLHYLNKVRMINIQLLPKSRCDETKYVVERLLRNKLEQISTEDFGNTIKLLSEITTVRFGDVLLVSIYTKACRVT